MPTQQGIRPRQNWRRDFVTSTERYPEKLCRTIVKAFAEQLKADAGERSCDGKGSLNVMVECPNGDCNAHCHGIGPGLAPSYTRRNAPDTRVQPSPLPDALVAKTPEKCPTRSHIPTDRHRAGSPHHSDNFRHRPASSCTVFPIQCLS